MSKRNNWLVAVAILGALSLTSCSTISGFFGGNSKRVANPNAEQEAKWDPLEALLPEDQVPVGWSVGGLNRAVEGESVDGVNSPGICGLTLDGPFQDEMTDGASLTLERSEDKQHIVIGVAQAPNAEKTMSSVSEQLRDCPSPTTFTTGELSFSVRLSEFSGEVLGQDGKTACRSYELTTDNEPSYGEFCIVAKKDLLAFTMSSAPSKDLKVPTAEFAEITDLQAKHLFD